MNITNNVQNNLIDNEHFQKYVLYGSKKDVEYWDNWLLDWPEREIEFLDAKKILSSLKIKSIFVSAEQYEIDLKKLKNAIDNSGKVKPNYLRINFKCIFKYVAIILISAGIGVFSVFKFSEYEADNISTSRSFEKSNPKGQKSIIMLPDGSKVYLNAASSLKYENDPVTGNRNVYLSGEAFFKVAKNENKPFNVYSNGIRTTALGTSFNVNAYNDKEKVTVYLSTGKVEVQSKEMLIYLEPGDGVSFNTKSKKLEKVGVGSKNILGWKSEVISFNNDGLEEVVKKLEKWYGVTINVEGVPKSEWNLNGEFEDQSLENVLNSLKYISLFNFEIDNEIVTLKF